MAAETDIGAVTVALPVAKFTAAVTSVKRLSFFSTRAAHAAHIMPRIESPTSRNSGDDAVPVTEADIQPLPPGRTARPASYAADTSASVNLHRREKDAIPGQGKRSNVNTLPGYREYRVKVTG